MIKNFKLTTLLLLVVVISFTACTSTLQAIRGVNLSALKLGMSKEEVQTLLRKKPDNIVAAKKYQETNSTVEVLQYSRWDGEKLVEVYWLYFVNNKLDKWEMANQYGPSI
jgi:hypothetical protein